MSGRDLEYTEGLSQEELMYISQSRAADCAIARHRRKSENQVRDAQDDEDLARALAASRISEEFLRNHPRAQSFQPGFQHHIIDARPQYSQNIPIGHSIQREAYDLEGLTEDEQLELAMHRSREDNERTADRRRPTQYTPPSTSPDSETNVREFVSWNDSECSKWERQRSQDQAREASLDGWGKDPWINDPNCLYDPQPSTERVQSWDFIDGNGDNCSRNLFEHKHQDWNQERIRGDSWLGENEHSHRSRNDHRNESPDFPRSPRPTSRRSVVNPDCPSHRRHGHRHPTVSEAAESTDQDPYGRRPSPTWTWSSPDATPQYPSLPPIAPAEPVQLNTSAHGRPIQYTFTGPVTINHCSCRDNHVQRNGSGGTGTHDRSRTRCCCRCDCGC